MNNNKKKNYRLLLFYYLFPRVTLIVQSDFFFLILFCCNFYCQSGSSQIHSRTLNNMKRQEVYYCAAFIAKPFKCTSLIFLSFLISVYHFSLYGSYFPIILSYSFSLSPSPPLSLSLSCQFLYIFSYLMP